MIELLAKKHTSRGIRRRNGWQARHGDLHIISRRAIQFSWGCRIWMFDEFWPNTMDFLGQQWSTPSESPWVSTPVMTWSAAVIFCVPLRDWRYRNGDLLNQTPQSWMGWWARAKPLVPKKKCHQRYLTFLSGEETEYYSRLRRGFQHSLKLKVADPYKPENG